MENEENDKVIADPIHGMMTFKPYLMKIINHKYFQRLRHIKQLQGVEHVYPGGVHSRFSHSLGMCYLAGKVLDKLNKETIETDYEITGLERKCVTISALCRDIGHGPFSYLYESLGEEFFSDKNEHITRGVEITKIIIDEVQLFNESESENAKTMIENMLKGKKVEDMEEEAERKKAFLYQIVRNEDNGVDVNRWDYICRDSHACGFVSNFDINRTVSGLRVVPYQTDGIDANVLAFPLKDQINLYNMFNLRFTLYSKVYYHPVVRCAEEINSISTKECRSQNKDFCLMDDKLLYLIYHADDDSSKLIYAKAIMDRIYDRDFYFCIYTQPLDRSEQIAKVDYGKKTENPIKDVYFYSKESDYAFKDDPPTSSPMVPQCFEEVTLRVICTLSKTDCDGFKGEIQSKIKQFIDELINPQRSYCCIL
ncbi:hypothetical protein KUTeg_015354 [Tegillarca granosa]|uniref:HD domain-containing protein n=1 Tax=Tegillarca granosa TaxID=220873 RepID=A0ABQ9EUE2_TEGGR|nr:hypothetical protein KUTeg_015354 [Tegillarca granosa]